MFLLKKYFLLKINCDSFIFFLRGIVILIIVNVLWGGFIIWKGDKIFWVYVG